MEQPVGSTLMAEVGTVAQLWRYPVKSFQGEMVDELAMAPGGAAGDRLLAVVDPGAKKVLSAKRYADLLQAAARLEGERVVITLPDGAEHASDDAGVHDALSAWLGMPVRLEPPPAEVSYPMEMYTGMSDEGTPLFDWTRTAGTVGGSGRFALAHHGQPRHDRRRASRWPVGRAPVPAHRADRDLRRRVPGGGLAHLRRRRGPGGGADAHHAAARCRPAPSPAWSGTWPSAPRSGT